MIREEETGEEGEKKKADFPFLISHFSFVLSGNCRKSIPVETNDKWHYKNIV